MALLGIPKGIWEKILHRIKNIYDMINVDPDYLPLVLRITEHRFNCRLVDWSACSRCRPKGVKAAPGAHQRHWMGAIASRFKLPEIILDIYIDMIDIDMINRLYRVSDEFLEKHLEKFTEHHTLVSILLYQHPSVEFLMKHRSEIKWECIIPAYGQQITNDLLYVLIKEKKLNIRNIVDNPGGISESPSSLNIDCYLWITLHNSVLKPIKK